MAGDMTQTEETDLSILGETKVQTDGGARMELTTLPQHRVLLVSLIAARRIKKPLEPVEFQDGDEDGEPARPQVAAPKYQQDRTPLCAGFGYAQHEHWTSSVVPQAKEGMCVWNSHKFVRVNHAAQDLKVFLGTAGAEHKKVGVVQLKLPGLEQVLSNACLETRRAYPCPPPPICIPPQWRSSSPWPS